MINEDEYYVVSFNCLDDYRCLMPLRCSLGDPDCQVKERTIIAQERFLRNKLESMFLHAGWEGDGEINCILVPPFLFQSDSRRCEVIYHVKQESSGTSWLIVPNNIKIF